MTGRAEILGCSIDRMDMERTLAAVEQVIAEGRYTQHMSINAAKLVTMHDDPRMREVNERNGDDHGVNLGKLRAIAKRLKTQQELARELWATDEPRPVVLFKVLKAAVTGGQPDIGENRTVSFE